ncbi:MAG: NAD(P)H-dependent oxidoreductase [Candidatus Riflebacteria bacterium]|nr:NAD(P)H-dependent oxidoreductase [Candidatus Riflebacteria bacterium]
MKTLLHLVASPRGEASSTLKISQSVIARFKEQNPDGRVDTLDLFVEDIPAVTVKVTEGKYQLLSGKELNDKTRPAWEPVIKQIKRFQDANIVLISSPMWNFGMPYVLKHYFDVIMQPSYLFRYTATGPEGLAKGKKVIVATSRGGDYSEGPAKAMDNLEPSLRTMLGFIGITDPTFINAQPMIAAGPDVAAQKLTQAVSIANKLVF